MIENESIDTLPFPARHLRRRAVNALKNERIFTIAELTRRDEIDLMRVPNLGPLTLSALKAALRERGLRLARAERDLAGRYIGPEMRERE
jgi:DNA-directed RNA polymerase alpha subunit